MTASAPGADGQSNRPPTARHFSVAPEPETPEGYVAPGMPGAPVAGYHPVDPADPAPAADATPDPNAPGRRRRREHGRPGSAVAIAVLAMLVGAAALGSAPIRAHATVGWLAIAPAAAVAWPLGRLGGPGRLLPPLGAVLASGALFLGQLLGQTRRLHHLAGTGYGELLRDALPLWRTDRRTLDLVFYGIAVIGGFLLTRRAATRQ